jgi:hypothetical protein
VGSVRSTFRRANMIRYISFVLMAVASGYLFTACSFQDPELDRELSKYRGAGIQRDGDRMPRRTPEDVTN